MLWSITVHISLIDKIDIMLFAGREVCIENNCARNKLWPEAAG